MNFVPVKGELDDDLTEHEEDDQDDDSENASPSVQPFTENIGKRN